MRKHGLRAFGLSFLALSALMAFMAVGAQANWLILSGGGTVETTAKVAAAAHTPGVLLIPAKNLEIECTTVTSEGITLAEKSTLATGKVAFSGCTTYSTAESKLTLASKCKPTNAEGKIKAGGVAHLLLHEGQNYVLLEPETGKPFTTIEFGPECALTETSTVKGSIVAECGHLKSETEKVFVHDNCATHQVNGLLQQVPGTTLFPNDKLIYGLNSAASVDGLALVSLEAPFLNASWGGHV